MNSYEFLWIRRTCDYIKLNAHYCMLFIVKIVLGLGLELDVVSGCAYVFVLVSTVIVKLPNSFWLGCDD